MYDITVETGFSSAHFLRNYEGKCERLHGHNYKVRVTVSAAELNEQGLAIDFKKLKESVNKFIEKFDHVNLNELPEFRDYNPTTENIARIIFEGLEKIINGETVCMKKVSVGETDGNYATYWK